MIEAIFHGHSFLEITDGNLRILVDPFITGNTSCDCSVEQLVESGIDAIVITHGHSDHVGNTVQLAQQSGCQVIATFEVVQWLGSQGISNLSAQHIGGEVAYEGFAVKYTPALHGGQILNEQQQVVAAGTAAGVIIRIGDKNIYHAGDTGLSMEMELLGRYETIDAAFLPIGDRFTMGIDDAVRATEMIGPSYVVPIHYNTRPLIKVDPVEFARKVMQLGGPTPKVLNPGQALVLS